MTMRRLAFSLLLGLLAAPLAGQASRDLDTNTDFIGIASVANTNSVSIAAWLNSDDVTGNHQCPLSRLSGATGWEICFNTSEVLWWAHTNDFNINLTSHTATIGKWHHILFAYSSTTGLNVYADCVSVATDASAGNISITTDIRVGIRTVGGLNPWMGSVAHLQLWDRQLSADECRQARHAPGSIARGSIGYWPFWGDSAGLVDLSGAGHPASNSGSVASSDGPAVFIPGGGP